MAEYAHVTRFIGEIERLGFDRAGELDAALTHALYRPEIVDKNYRDTLDRYRLEGARPWTANVESLDLRATMALLTWVHRADHFENGMMARCLENGFVYRILLRIAELDGNWMRPKIVTFYHEYDEGGYLSNWYESPFEFSGTTFQTGEHWMMWHKARLFRDLETAERILQVTDPDEVKKLGKQVSPFVDTAWDEVRVPIMTVGLRQKFMQSELLANELLSTGSAVLAEAAPNDRTWGVGIGKGDPGLDDPLAWHGRNLLGIALMNVRSDLRALAAVGIRMEPDVDVLRGSQIWGMSLLQLARVPSTRPFALMYAQMVNQSAPHVFHGTRHVMRKIDGSIGDINEQMGLNMGCGLPIVGWGELLDELVFQVTVGRV